jgi:hypothetical protein
VKVPSPLLRSSDVQTPELIVQARLRCAVAERAVLVVPEELEWRTTVDARCDEVQQPVAVDVIDDHASRQCNGVQPGASGHIGEATDVLARGKGARRDQLCARHAVRIRAREHVGDVQQPPHFEVIGPLAQIP